LVIDEDGHKLGEFLTSDALQLAQDRGLDLIEVAPNGHPPVCKISNYGRLKYERKKREAAARKNQVQQQVKELKLRPKTDGHDMAVKVKHARRFLGDGNKVKVTVRFRGREMAHKDIGAQQCLALARECKDIGVIEAHPRMEGRQMFMIMAPSRKSAPKPKAPEESPKPTEKSPKPAEEPPKPAEEPPKPAEEPPKPAEESPKPEGTVASDD
jgi:translation initiation factor IF-3